MCRSDFYSKRIAATVKRAAVPVVAATLVALMLGACANVPKLGDSFMLADAP